MKNLLILCVMMCLMACGNKGEGALNKNKNVDTVGEENAQFPVDRDDPKSANVDQARQMMNVLNAKREEINKRVTHLIESGANGKLILQLGQPMEKIRPMIDRFEGVIKAMENGEPTDFLSEEDQRKLNYRKQSQADALMDSLAYINSLIDVVLNDSDVIIQENK